ncbi:hypothetical protein Plhal703r1_c08g0044751 [Plasmopara halstedii]
MTRSTRYIETVKTIASTPPVAEYRPESRRALVVGNSFSVALFERKWFASMWNR